MTQVLSFLPSLSLFGFTSPKNYEATLPDHPPKSQNYYFVSPITSYQNILPHGRSIFVPHGPAPDFLVAGPDTMSLTSVTVLLFQLCGAVILTRSRSTLRGLKGLKVQTCFVLGRKPKTIILMSFPAIHKGGRRP